MVSLSKSRNPFLDTSWTGSGWIGREEHVITGCVGMHEHYTHGCITQQHLATVTPEQLRQTVPEDEQNEEGPEGVQCSQQ